MLFCPKRFKLFKNAQNGVKGSKNRTKSSNMVDKILKYFTKRLQFSAAVGVTAVKNNLKFWILPSFFDDPCYYPWPLRRLASTRFYIFCQYPLTNSKTSHILKPESNNYMSLHILIVMTIEIVFFFCQTIFLKKILWCHQNQNQNLVKLLIGKGLCITFLAVNYECLIDNQIGWS